MNPLRERVKKLLSNYFSEKYTRKYEKCMYLLSKRILSTNSDPDPEDLPFIYKELTYDKSGHFIQAFQNKDLLNSIVKDIDESIIGWYSCVYDDYRERLIEQQTDLIIGEDIKDGHSKCSKCKNTKVTFYQLQTRGADEPATLFMTCTKCKNKWKEQA